LLPDAARRLCEKISLPREKSNDVNAGTFCAGKSDQYWQILSEC
jgi:hypothetical protein